MGFVIVMTMALVTAMALVPCAATLLFKSADRSLRTRTSRAAATDARIRAIFGDEYARAIDEPAQPVKTVRPVRGPVMQYANSLAYRKAG